MIDVLPKSMQMVAVLSLALHLLSLPVAAEPGEASALTSGQKNLVERYIEAITTDDLAALKGLYHAEAFSCIDEENRSFNDMDAWLERHFSVDYGQEVSFRSVSYAAMTESADAALRSQPSLPIHSMAEGWSFAVAPTHQVFILEKSKDPEEPSGLPLPKTKLLLVEKDDAWWLTYACVEAKGREMQQYIQAMGAKAERADSLFTELDAKTKDRLKEVVAAGDAVDQQARFQEILQQATGETDAMTLNLLAAKAYGELLPVVLREKGGK